MQPPAFAKLAGILDDVGELVLFPKPALPGVLMETAPAPSGDQRPAFDIATAIAVQVDDLLAPFQREDRRDQVGEGDFRRRRAGHGSGGWCGRIAAGFAAVVLAHRKAVDEGLGGTGTTNAEYVVHANGGT